MDKDKLQEQNIQDIINSTNASLKKFLTDNLEDIRILGTKVASPQQRKSLIKKLEERYVEDSRNKD